MHPRMLHEVIERCRQRDAEGDCPTAEAFSVEILESAVVELAKKTTDPRTFPLLFDNAWLEKKLAADPDLDCEVGTYSVTSKEP